MGISRGNSGACLQVNQLLPPPGSSHNSLGQGGRRGGRRQPGGQPTGKNIVKCLCVGHGGSVRSVFTKEKCPTGKFFAALHMLQQN